MDEPLDLLWSNIDRPERTVKPRVNQRLDIFCIANNEGVIRVWADVFQFRIVDALSRFTANDILRFDILVGAKDCLPVEFSMKVRLQDRWDKPLLELIQHHG